MRCLNAWRQIESIRRVDGRFTTAASGQMLARRVTLVVGCLLLSLAAPHCLASDTVVYDLQDGLLQDGLLQDGSLQDG